MGREARARTNDLRDVANYIVDRLHQHYHVGAGVMNLSRIPVEARVAHKRLIEAALGPERRDDYTIAIELSPDRSSRYVGLDPALGDSIAVAFIARIGSACWVTFHDVPLPGFGVERAYTSRMNNGPTVRLIHAYDAMRDAYMLRADISVSVIGSREAAA